MTPAENSSLIVKQLVAVKAQCDVLSAMVGSLLAAMVNEGGPATSGPVAAPASDVQPDAPEGPCAHPRERRVPLPVMGPKKFKCADCNEDVLEEG